MDRVHCDHCGDVVGVYEPARLQLADGTARSGSLVSFDELLTASGGIVVHGRCHELVRCHEPFHEGRRRDHDAPD